MKKNRLILYITIISLSIVFSFIPTEYVRAAIGNLIGQEIHIVSSAQKLYVDTNELCFTDGVTGNKSLSDLAAGGSGISDIVEDTTPQLGGDLDLNGKNLDFPTTANISDVKDEDDMASNSATMLSTQQSIKAYTDGKTTKYYAATASKTLSDATGDTAYTGIGFTPKVIIMIGFLSNACISVGQSESVNQSGGNCVVAHTQATTAFTGIASRICRIYVDSANDQRGIVSAYGADGFTITWTKTGSPTGTATIYYICLG